MSGAPRSLKLALMLGLLSGSAARAEGWPDAGARLGEGSSVTLVASHRHGEIPPFATAAVDLGRLGLDGRWAIAPRAELRLSYELRHVRWPDGERRFGSGDIEVGASAMILRGEGLRPAIWLNTETKLPNAPDHLGLGTDMADFTAWALARWVRPRWAITVGPGLAILGDPTRLTEQDDALVALAAGTVDLGPIRWMGAVEGRVFSARNPADLRLSAGGELGPLDDRLRLGAFGELGLTPAAPTWGAGLRIGWAPQRQP